MSRPIIGFTSENSFTDVLKWFTALSIWIAGGKPVRLYPKKPQYDRHIDGLIICGGTDVYPKLYKVEPKLIYKYDHDRDTFEMKWLNKAEANNIPVMGICRGAQLMNVARGGSLHIDISKVYQNAQYPTKLLARIFFRKDITIECGTLLERLLKTQRLPVNSMHMQSVDTLGDCMVMSAKEDNGVVQAIEDPSKDFYLGVQFHPEALIYKKLFRDMFREFIQISKPKKT